MIAAQTKAGEDAVILVVVSVLIVVSVLAAAAAEIPLVVDGELSTTLA